MGKLRFLLALWLAKLSVPALKITRHNGTDFPGSLARCRVVRSSLGRTMRPSESMPRTIPVLFIGIILLQRFLHTGRQLAQQENCASTV